MWWAACPAAVVRCAPFHSVPPSNQSRSWCRPAWIGLADSRSKKESRDSRRFLSSSPKGGRATARAAACSHGCRDLVEDAVRSGSVYVFFLCGCERKRLTGEGESARLLKLLSGRDLWVIKVGSAARSLLDQYGRWLGSAMFSVGWDLVRFCGFIFLF
jgi:hypothetical protein